MIERCINTGAIQKGTSAFAGGIVGFVSQESDPGNIKINECFNSGNITSTAGADITTDVLGGILALCWGTSNTNYSYVTYCGNTGNVRNDVTGGASKQSYAGLVANSSNIHISHSYNTGSVHGVRYVAGLAGPIELTKTYKYLGYCYNTGAISGSAGVARLGIWYNNDDYFKTKEYNYAGGSGGTYMYYRYNRAGGYEGYANNEGVIKDFNHSSMKHFYPDNYGITPSNTNKVLAWQVPPTIIRNPFNVIRPEGTTATLDTVVYGAMGEMNYQWYVSNSKDGDYDEVDGAEASTIEVTCEDQGKWYYCEVTGIDVTGNNVVAITEKAFVGVGEYVATDAILMEESQGNVITNKYVLGNTATNRDNVLSITIKDNLDIPEGTLFSEAWDVSLEKSENVKAWLVKDTSDTSKYHLIIGGDGMIQASNGKYLFANYPNCTAINGLNKLNTTKVEDMSYMFAGCSSLTTMNVGSFDTSIVGNMEYMFDNCSNLTSIDVSSFDTLNVTKMKCMFNNCKNVSNLIVDGFDTSSVTNMNSMFQNCEKITSLNVTGFNTNNVIDMAYMFNGCKNLTSLNVSNFNTGKVTDMKYMFGDCEKIASLNATGFNTSNVTDMEGMFDGCSNLTGLDLNGFNTSNVTNMKAMFSGCSKLTSLTVSAFDTRKVTNMAKMFNKCESIEKLDLKTFNTSKVKDMTAMFADCSSIESVYLYKFNTSNVENFAGMFANCSDIEKLDMLSFDTTKAKSYAGMFSGCSSLTGLNLRNFKTSALNGTASDFEGTSIEGTLVNLDEMLNGCTSLRSVLFGKNFMRLDGISMFNGCTSLNAIILENAIISANKAPVLGTETGLNGLSNVKLYVPDEESRTQYISATNYANIFTAEKIKEMMEIVGDNPTKVDAGTEYSDLGVAVIDRTKDNAGDYTQYNYFVSESGLPVDTNRPGTHEVVYTLMFAEENIVEQEPAEPEIVPITSIEFEYGDYYQDFIFDIYDGLGIRVLVNEDATEKLIWTVDDPNVTIEVSEDTRMAYIINENAFENDIYVITVSNQDGTIQATHTVEIGEDEVQ